MFPCHPPVSVLTSPHIPASHLRRERGENTDTNPAQASLCPKEPKCPRQRLPGCERQGQKGWKRGITCPFGGDQLQDSTFSPWSDGSIWLLLGVEIWRAEDVMSIHSFSFLVIISAPRANISRARQGSWWTGTDSERLNHAAGENKGRNDNGAAQGLFTV